MENWVRIQPSVKFGGRKARRRTRRKRGGQYAGFNVGDRVILSQTGIVNAMRVVQPNSCLYPSLMYSDVRNNARNWTGIVRRAQAGTHNDPFRGKIRVKWNFHHPHFQGRLNIPYKDYKDGVLAILDLTGTDIGPDRGGPISDIRLRYAPERVQEAGINSNQPGGRRRKSRRKTRRKRGGNYAGFNVGDQVVLSDAGLARIAAGPPFPAWSSYRWGIQAGHLNNTANWLGTVTYSSRAPVDIRLRGMVSVSWNSPPTAGLGRHTILATYKDYAVPVPAHGYVGHAALSRRGGPVGDIRELPNYKQPGGRRRKTRKKRRRRTRKKRGGVDFQPGDKVKFSPKMREDLTGVRSENALNWMETWTGTVESVNDAKPKKAVQVYWKTGGESEGWTSVPKEHLIKLSGSQTGSGRKRKARRKPRRRTRKKRGGGWITVSDGKVDTNLETTVEILRRMIGEQQRVRISSEHVFPFGGTGRPYEGTVNRVWVVDPAEDDPSIIGLIVPEYYIPYAGEPNRVPCQYGGPYGGEYFRRPIKIELWEEPTRPKRPKSARKVHRHSTKKVHRRSTKKVHRRSTKKVARLPLTVLGPHDGVLPLTVLGPHDGVLPLTVLGPHDGGRRRKRRTRRGRKKRRKTRRKRRKRRRQRGGGDPQKDLHDSIKENHEVGAIQAIHNGAKVNQARDYTRPKPLEDDSPEGRICTGETIMRKGKQTPLTHAIQENAMIGIAEHILGNRVGQEPGINLDFKDPWYEPPKTAYEIAKDVNNIGAMERINDRRAADAGFGSGGGDKMDVDSETDKKNKFKF